MRGVFATAALFLLFVSSSLFAGVPLGILPFKGVRAVKKVEGSIKEALVKAGGVTVLADSVMKEIIKRQEAAQSLGSAYHDISKLKVAEYLLEGTFEGKSLRLKVIDVNTGALVFNQAIAVQGRAYRITDAARKIRQAVILHASSKKREVPEDVAPYMDYLKEFTRSLGRGDAASYPYLVFYYGGKYQHPHPKNLKLVETASIFLKVVRPNLVRSRLVYVSVKSKAPWAYISVVAIKLGRKTMHRFGIIELPDGSIGISIYEPDK